MGNYSWKTVLTKLIPIPGKSWRATAVECIDLVVALSVVKQGMFLCSYTRLHMEEIWFFFYQRVQYSNSLISTICSIDSKTTKTTKSILSISYPFRSFFPWILWCRYTYIHFSGTRECIFQCSYRANGHTWTAQRKAYWHPLTWVLIKATLLLAHFCGVHHT